MKRKLLLLIAVITSAISICASQKKAASTKSAEAAFSIKSAETLQQFSAFPNPQEPEVHYELAGNQTTSE